MPVPGAVHAQLRPGYVAKSRVRALIVIKVPPFLNDQFGLLPANEPFPVQAFVAQVAGKALDETVLPWTAWLNVGRPDVQVVRTHAQPRRNLCGRMAPFRYLLKCFSFELLGLPLAAHHFSRACILSCKSNFATNNKKLLGRSHQITLLS